MPHRKIFFVLFSALFVAMLGAGIIAPTMPLYAEKLGAGGFCLGFIWSSFSLSRAIFQPMMGKLSDRRGRKIFILTGLTIYTLASVGYIWSDTIVELIWVRFLHGIGSAMVIPVAAAVIGDLSHQGKEGVWMGGFGVTLFLGFGFGPLLGGVLTDLFTMSLAFLAMGLLSLLALLLIWFFLPEDKDQYIQQRPVSPFRVMWKSGVVRGLLAFRFSNAVCRSVILSFLPIFSSRLDLSTGQIGILVSSNVLLTGLLQQVFGKLADRINRRILIVSGNIITAVSIMAIPLAKDYGTLMVLGIIMGSGSGMAFPAAGALATELGRDHGMGNMMGYFNFSMSLGMVTGPILSGFILDRWNLRIVFLAAGLIGVLGSVYSWRHCRENRGTETHAYV